MRTLEQQLAAAHTLDRLADNTAQRARNWRAWASHIALPVARDWGQESAASVITELVAGGEYDALLLGVADSDTQALRQELMQRAVTAIVTATAADDGARRVVEDYVAVDLAARFRWLSPTVAAELERVQQQWGYARSFSGERRQPEMAMPPHHVVYPPVEMLSRYPGWPAAKVDEAEPGVVPREDEGARSRLPAHIAVHLTHGVMLADFWMHPYASDPHRSFKHVWFAVQDRARLVPFDSKNLRAPEPEFVADVGPLIGAIEGWWETFAKQYRAIAGRYSWRDGPPGTE